MYVSEMKHRYNNKILRQNKGKGVKISTCTMPLSLVPYHMSNAVKYCITKTQDCHSILVLRNESTEFNDILPEQKMKIFQYLNVKQRQKIRSVCTIWRDVINEGYGIRIKIRNTTNDLVRTCENAVEVELCSMTIPFPSGSVAFVNRLQNLKFANIVVTYNIIFFLKECPNIKSLCFVNVVIDIPMDDPWSPPESKEAIPLRKLESIEIQCWTFTDSVTEFLNFLKDKILYGSLKEIIVTARNPPVLPLHTLFTDENPEENHTLLKLVTNNIQTLRKFVVGRPTASTVFQFHPYGIFNDSIPVQLSQLTVNSYFREEWSAFFHNQNHIEILDVGSVNVNRWDEIHQGIIRNAGSMKNFTMFGSTFGQEWDCTIFTNCVILDSLTLEIRNSPKINLRIIPLQLRRLDIWGPIALPEILSILTLINLKFLKLSNLVISGAINEPEDDKIDLETFQALIQLPVLRTLCFASCTRFSLDLTRIIGWCAANTPRGLQYDTHYFHNVIHGVNTPDGITVTIYESFDRDPSRWNNDLDVPYEESRFDDGSISTVSVQ